MGDLSKLKNRRNIYKRQLEDKEKELAYYEDMYDTLINFKNNVERSHSDFGSVNSDKYNMLQNLLSVKKNSNIAEQYLEGMIVDLKDIGGGNVSGEFQELLMKIDKKKSDCMRNIGKCEMEIYNLKNQIVGLNNSIVISEQRLK